MAQAEIGTYATSYIPTTTVAVPRDADVVSVANPIPAWAKRWCIAGTYKINAADWIGANSNARRFALGPAGTDAAYLSGNYFGIYDATTTQKYIGAYTSPATTTSRIVACSEAGRMSLLVGNTLYTAVNGAGTGVITTQPANLYLGSDNGANLLNGNIKNFKVCASAGKDCK
jgi:hypothetical protein